MVQAFRGGCAGMPGTLRIRTSHRPLLPPQFTQVFMFTHLVGTRPEKSTPYVPLLR